MVADLQPCLALAVSRSAGEAGAAAPAPAAAADGDAVPGLVNYLHHGADWQQGTCGSRARQSPISLDTNLEDPPEDFFKYRYAPIIDPALMLDAINGTLTLDVVGLGLGGVEYQQVPYELIRVDVRGPSEHLVKGEQQPLELQLVHRETSVASGHHTLIISVLVWCEHAPNNTVET